MSSHTVTSLREGVSVIYKLQEVSAIVSIVWYEKNFKMKYFFFFDQYNFKMKYSARKATMWKCMNLFVTFIQTS